MATPRGSQFVLAFWVACLAVIHPAVGARADDAGAIAAVVTASQTAQGMSTPGVFAQFTLIENLPYARVSASNGIRGFGSMSYVLSKTSGAWQILGQGGGILGTSEMVAFGVPPANAKILDGHSCAGKDHVVRDRVHVTRAQVDARLYRLAIARGPSVLPRTSATVLYRGHRMLVDVVTPLDFYRCQIPAGATY
jgi:hypothetical protein